MKFYQVNTLNSLMLGNFDRTVSVKDFMNGKDTGIGTYEGLNGEAIFMDGVAYNGTADGNVKIMKDDDYVAFGTVCKFDNSVSYHTLENVDLDALKKDIVPDNPNYFYVLKTDKIKFDTMHVRSCYPSEKPYPTLSQVASCQREFHYTDIEGYMIAVWCPEYVKGINLPGWHFHFLSADKTKGGHILGMSAKEFVYQLNACNEFDLTLPTNKEFATRNLCEDLSAKTKAVEG